MTRPETIPLRLRQLFGQVRSPDGDVYRNAEIVQLARAAGYPLSEAQLRALRRGAVPNPTLSTLAAVAAAFDVPIGALLDEGDHVDQVALDLARRVSRLPEPHRALALEMIRGLERIAQA